MATSAQRSNNRAHRSDKGKKRKILTGWEETIDSSNLGDCKQIQKRLEKLLKRANQRVASLEAEAKRKGFTYNGVDAVKCSLGCGNTFDPEDEYCGVCEKCTEDEENVCIECLNTCNECGDTACDECTTWCESCEKYACDDGCSDICCDCDERFCTQCLKDAINGYCCEGCADRRLSHRY